MLDFNSINSTKITFINTKYVFLKLEFNFFKDESDKKSIQVVREYFKVRFLFCLKSKSKISKYTSLKRN